MTASERRDGETVKQLDNEDQDSKTCKDMFYGMGKNKTVRFQRNVFYDWNMCL